jgi:hypothetical protein
VEPANAGAVVLLHAAHILKTNKQTKTFIICN